MKFKNTALSCTFLPSATGLFINVRGRLLSFDRPRIMGILNITSDSFYSGSRVPREKDYLERAEQMLAEGADMLDLGGQSTRPDATLITAEEEKQRVLPAITSILNKFPDTVISVDTFYASVAEAAVNCGAAIINDISAGNMDSNMIKTVAKMQVPYIAMHMRGTPATMQKNPVYKNVSLEILDFFIKKLAECRSAGIKDVIADPGFGFGKNTEHNYSLLGKLAVLQELNIPLMVGISRKSMIWRLLNITPEEALNATSALHMLALQQGAHILRVHDVKPAREVIELWTYYVGATYFE